MSFNETVYDRIVELEARFDKNTDKMVELNRKMLEEAHYCNCEHCDISDEQDDFEPSEAKKEIEKLSADNEAIMTSIRRLKVYAKDHKLTFTARTKA